VFHGDEPPQTPNKSPKKVLFFLEICTWLEPGLKNRCADASILVENAFYMVRLGRASSI